MWNTSICRLEHLFTWKQTLHYLLSIWLRWQMGCVKWIIGKNPRLYCWYWKLLRLTSETQMESETNKSITMYTCILCMLQLFSARELSKCLVLKKGNTTWIWKQTNLNPAKWSNTRFRMPIVLWHPSTHSGDSTRFLSEPLAVFARIIWKKIARQPDWPE